MKPLELLAPAKDMHSGIAAISCGADAVYIGGPQFGARAAAGNSMHDIQRLTTYAHRYFAKVYMVINTLLYDNEIPEAVLLAQQAWKSGVDALIIQDLGMLEAALPPIPLFASTQTNNTSPAKVKFLEDAGFSRVILARELNIKQIQEIRQATTVDLEFFIHGALCVSYSGQCYLSQALTGRSANRGVCAQPCRMAYNLLDDKGRRLRENQHLLSLKDLNLSNHLPQLVEAGITSFKIEGRLKDETYVKNAVLHYRQILDNFLINQDSFSKASSGKVEAQFNADPERSFSRGFTSYFVEQRSTMASLQTPKSVGKKIGVVSKVDSLSFTVTSNETLSNGDGICFVLPNGILEGTNINKVENGRIYPNSIENISAGITIYRNFDREFTLKLEKAVERKIETSISLSEINKVITITSVDEDGIDATIAISSGEMEKANNPERALKTWHEQLSKGGNSILRIVNVTIQVTDLPFMPISGINQLRRELLQQHEANRVNAYKRVEKKVVISNHPYPESEIGYQGNVLNALAKKFYERHGTRVVRPAYEAGLPAKGDLVMTTKYCLRYELGDCLKKRAPVNKQLPSTLFLENNGQKLTLEFDCERCEMMIKLA
ncbi:MAG TPA: U32 family peptidase [Williamwhitmania sp.]|nr:U32 family peptidase [Williamwhitmania sp.]